jgi:hypothetical protein
LTGAGRYIQFTVQRSTSDGARTPALKNVALIYKLP